MTGATGLLGSRLVSALAKDACILALVHTDKGKEAALLRGAHSAAAADLRNHSAVIAAVTQMAEPLDGLDAVVHTAGLMDFYPGSEAAVRDQYVVNVGGTVAVVIAARQNGRQVAGQRSLPLFVALSSTEAVGQSEMGNEEAARQPSYPYGVTKMALEDRLLGSGLPSIILRPTGVLAAGDFFAMFELMASVWAGVFVVAPEGIERSFLHFTHAADVVQGMLRALQAGGCALQRPQLSSLLSHCRALPRDAPKGLPPRGDPALADATTACAWAAMDPAPAACQDTLDLDARSQTLQKVFILSPPDNPSLLDWFRDIAVAAGRWPPVESPRLPLPLLRHAMTVLGPVVQWFYPPTFFYHAESVDRYVLWPPLTHLLNSVLL